jgi:squalene-associated FAD-dependent desaturase
MSDNVIIIGGGLAGLAAAVALTQNGVRCTVLESRPRLGGRASSFPDANSEQWVDNCQHVAMGCCTNFHKFCKTTGIDTAFERQRELYFINPDTGRVHRFHANGLPAPLHLAGSFAGLSYLTLRDKFALSRGLKALAAPSSIHDPRPFSEWLGEHQQPPRTIERFWHVVLVSALSESLDRINVAAARKVFVDGFLRHRDGWAVDIPTESLDELFGRRVPDWIESHGGTVRRQAAVERMEITHDTVTGVRLKLDEMITANHVILAVPWYRVAALLPEPWASCDAVAKLSHLEAAPISSVHFWFDRPLMTLPHAVFVSGLVQWVFNRSNREGEALAEPLRSKAQGNDHGSAGASPSQDKTYYYQVVISASRNVLEQPSETIRDQVLTELARVWPVIREAQLRHWRLVTEHRAVFSVTPGSDALRPPQQSPLPNLQFAGDWTQTGWPATMEGAVRSGFLAAENVLAKCGRAVKLLAPDLPTARLSRWLFGL